MSLRQINLLYFNHDKTFMIMSIKPPIIDVIIITSKNIFICTSIPKIERIVNIHPATNATANMRIKQYIRASPAPPSILIILLVVIGLSIWIIESSTLYFFLFALAIDIFFWILFSRTNDLIVDVGFLVWRKEIISEIEIE